MGVVESGTFDVRDARLLEELARARILSTAQLAQLGGHPEPLGAMAQRLTRLAHGGWIRPVPRVRVSQGSVTGWHRADQMLPAENRGALAAEAIRLNAIYAALRTGPKAVEWRLKLASPVTAIMMLAGRRLHLCWTENGAVAREACARFASQPRDPERGDAQRADDEVVLLCDELDTRDALRREVERLRARMPAGPSAVHVALARDAIRVLFKRLHGSSQPPDLPPEPVLSRDERERIVEFLSEVL